MIKARTNLLLELNCFEFKLLNTSSWLRQCDCFFRKTSKYKTVKRIKTIKKQTKSSQLGRNRVLTNKNPNIRKLPATSRLCKSSKADCKFYLPAHRAFSPPVWSSRIPPPLSPRYRPCDACSKRDPILRFLQSRINVGSWHKQQTLREYGSKKHVRIKTSSS